MNRSLAAIVLLLAIVGTIAASATDEARIKVERSEHNLRIRARVPGKEQWCELATFVMDPKLRPYLHPLRQTGDHLVIRLFNNSTRMRNKRIPRRAGALTIFL